VSAPSTMTCERANQLLTELVCGELGADEAASVRAHAESCGRCGPELSRYARVLAVAQELPLEAPAPAVDQRIMQAAREALSRRAGGAVAIDSSTPSSGIKAWLERLGTWAMSPQVAMASVLLLVVGIGLYALPFGEDGAPAALQLAQEPEGVAPQTATATSAPVEASRKAREVVPAGPQEDAYDLKRAAAPAAEAPTAFQDALQEKPTLRARRPAPESKAVSAGSRKGLSLDELDGLGGVSGEGSGVGSGAAGGRGNALPAPAPAPKPVSAAKDRAMNDLVEPAFAPSPPPAPAEERSAQAPRRAEPSAPAPADAESADYAAAPVASTREAAKQKAESAPEPSYATLLADGIAAAQAGNYARAVSLLEPVVASGPITMRGSARTWLARSLRGLGQCERALTYYAPLVDAPSPPIAILNEAADCYAQVGRLAQAEELRMRAKASAGAKAAPVKAAPAAGETKQ
jgi:hypothetical protein